MVIRPTSKLSVYHKLWRELSLNKFLHTLILISNLVNFNVILNKITVPKPLLYLILISIFISIVSGNTSRLLVLDISSVLNTIFQYISVQAF